jgi:hypothetical protein
LNYKKLYFRIFVLAVLSPLGLPASGSAWGEWGSDEVKRHIGFVPKGMQALKSLWSGVLSGYNLPGFQGKFLEAVGYIISAMVGILIILLIFKILQLVLVDNSENGLTEK